MSNENVVLVTGRTGSQGGATVTHLLAAKKVLVRVLTRNLDSPKARSLAARGVELIKGDFDDVASLRTASAGVSAAYSVQQWTEKGGTAAEALHGFKANIVQVRREYPQLLTFAGWLKKYTDEH